MRRRSAVVLLPVALVLTACVPTAFDPQTGTGADALLAEYAALDETGRLAAIADSDRAAARALWRESGIDDAVGGATAADEIFAGLLALLEDETAATRPDASTFALASTTQNLNEAHGAGMFAGMLVSSLLTEAGLAATKDGATGNASQDFGKGTSVTIDAREDGTTVTTLDMSTEYKGVQIQLSVSTEVDPCPDVDGWVEPKGVYQVVIEGPDGTGNVTQVEVAMEILVNDDAEIGMSDYDYRTVYVSKPKPTSGGAFDMTGGALDFERSADGKRLVVNAREGWSDDAFLGDAFRTGAFLAEWVAASLAKSVEQGWKDGRCIELAISPSAGPTGLDPGDVVSVLAQPIAKRDAAPAGGTVVATLTDGGYAIGPDGEKVPAGATFTYEAPREVNESGTVHFESRSRRGIGRADITFDTRAQHYAVSGGSGVFAGTGEWCAGAQAFSTIGGDVTTFYQLDGADGGSVQYSGGNMTGGWAGGGSFSVERRDGIPVALRVTYAGQFYALNGAVLPHSETMTFSITPKDSCDNA